MRHLRFRLIVAVASVAFCLAPRDSIVSAEDAPKSRSVVLEFPSDRSLGILYWHASHENLSGLPTDWDDDWHRVTRARGKVRLPGEGLRRLEVSRTGAADLSPLARFPTDSFQSLSLWNANATDGALAPIARLSDLRWLDLTQNPLSDAGLSVLSGLKNLEEIRLSYTQAGDETAAWLPALPSLRSLGLWGTRITDAGMQHVGRIATLEMLNIGSQNVTDAGLAELAGLVNLKSLSIDKMPITDAGIRHLPNLKNLEWLDVTDTKISNACRADIAQIEKLKYLRLRNEGLSDGGLEHLADLPNLETLFAEQGISDRGLEGIGRLRHLKKLDVRGTFSDDGLVHLTALPKLEELSIESKNVGNAGLEHVAAIANLKRIWLQGVRIDDDGLSAFRGLPLEELLLNSTGVSSRGLNELGQLKQLTSLYLGSGFRVLESLKFLDNMPSLKKLKIPIAVVPSDEWAHLENLHHLEELEVSMDDAGIRYLAGQSSLRHVILTGPIGDDGLKSLARLRELRRLVISGKSNVTDRGLEHLSGLSSLWMLRIQSDHLTEVGREEFAAKMRGLTHFSPP
jgi:Leucine-rich repeat (LRR) protein